MQCRGLQTGEVSWESPFFETEKGTDKHRCHEIGTHIFSADITLGQSWASGVIIPRGMQRIALAMLGSTIYGFKKYLELGCWIMSVAQALLDFPTWERAPCSTHCVTPVRQWCNIATCFDMLLHLFQSLLQRLFASVYHHHLYITYLKQQFVARSELLCLGSISWVSATFTTSADSDRFGC